MDQSINLNFVENRLKKIVENSAQIKIFQQHLENVLRSVEENMKSYKRGEIGPKLFKENQEKWEIEGSIMLASIKDLSGKNSDLVKELIRYFEKQKMRE